MLARLFQPTNKKNLQRDYKNLFILGPVTVPMVSTNSSPPIAMPVQVPPGHVVQQIVDESGTLRHVILSPQHPTGLVPLASHNPQHYVSIHNARTYTPIIQHTLHTAHKSY